jgi:hypothetical protein
MSETINHKYKKFMKWSDSDISEEKYLLRTHVQLTTPVNCSHSTGQSSVSGISGSQGGEYED